MSLDLDQAYIALLEKTLHSIRRYKNDQLKSSGVDITTDQWELLRQIAAHPGSSQKKLAELSSKDPASVKRSLDLLGNKGLIEKEVLEADRREQVVNLTEEGKSVLHKLLPVAIDLKAKGVAGLSQEEMDFMGQILFKIHSNFKIE